MRKRPSTRSIVTTIEAISGKGGCKEKETIQDGVGSEERETIQDGGAREEKDQVGDIDVDTMMNPTNVVAEVRTVSDNFILWSQEVCM